jgi:8-oxo-dGTP pyrophosphatase MutT (NUDIX family)
MRTSIAAALAKVRASSHNGSVSSSVPILPAATVIVLRDIPVAHASTLEVLLVQRAGELAFHGGAWVFPGGRVDAVDRPLHASAGADAELLAARAAGVRETFEEAGLCLTPDELAPFSHWTTPEGRSRRFATWFFLAQIEPHLECVVDGGEILAHRWYRPAEALLARERGEIDLPPPTYVSLAALSACSTAAEALASTRAAAPPVILPRPRPLTEGGLVSLVPGDAAYDGGHLDAAGARHRLWMQPSGYRYQRDS